MSNSIIIEPLHYKISQTATTTSSFLRGGFVFCRFYLYFTRKNQAGNFFCLNTSLVSDPSISLVFTMAKITEEEFVTYYDSYSRALFQHCYLRVYDWEYAKDLVQDIYLRAWNHLQQGNEVIYMRAFLYRIANNLIIDGARRRKRRGGDPYSIDVMVEEGWEPHDNAHRQVEFVAEASVAFQALRRLDKQYQQVILMRYVDGLEPKDIADRLGESANAISIRLHRGIKKLRDLLEINETILADYQAATETIPAKHSKKASV